MCNGIYLQDVEIDFAQCLVVHPYSTQECWVEFYMYKETLNTCVS